MHLRFADLGRVRGKLRAVVESSCSSLGGIVRIAWCEVERKCAASESCRRLCQAHGREILAVHRHTVGQHHRENLGEHAICVLRYFNHFYAASKVVKSGPRP